eukprot:3638001-Rhodomonas_salina.3
MEIILPARMRDRTRALQLALLLVACGQSVGFQLCPLFRQHDSPKLFRSSTRCVYSTSPRIQKCRTASLLHGADADSQTKENQERPSILDAYDLSLQNALQLNKIQHRFECEDYEDQLYAGKRTLKAASFSQQDVDRLGGPGVELSACKTTSPLFSQEECQAVIDEAELVAAQHGWSTKRHRSYATTDIPIVELPKSKAWFIEQLEVKVFPFLEQCFPESCGSCDDYRIFDVFVVKYSGSGGQSLLHNHRDGSLLSINIALNPSVPARPSLTPLLLLILLSLHPLPPPLLLLLHSPHTRSLHPAQSEFEGGGTWIEALGRAVRIGAGDMLAHSSCVLHGGAEVTAGVRARLWSQERRKIEREKRGCTRASTQRVPLAVLHSVFSSSTTPFPMLTHVAHHLFALSQIEQRRRMLERAAGLRQEGMLADARAAIRMLAELPGGGPGEEWGDAEFRVCAGPLAELVR